MNYAANDDAVKFIGDEALRSALLNVAMGRLEYALVQFDKNPAIAKIHLTMAVDDLKMLLEETLGR